MQQGMTVANALTGEKSWKEVKFAITGDAHADLVAGIKAIINEFFERPSTTNLVLDREQHRALLATMEYMTVLCRNKVESCDRAIADEKERQYREHQLRSLGAGNYPRSDEKAWTAPWTTSAAAMTASEVKAAADRIRANLDAKASDALNALQVDYDKIRAELMREPLSKASIPNPAYHALHADLGKAH